MEGALRAPDVAGEPGPERVSIRAGLGSGARLALGIQRGIGWMWAPLWAPAAAGAQGLLMGWTIEDHDALRQEYRRIRSAPGPLLLCANHLTLVDSAIIAWALGSPMSYVRDFAALPWNLPESRNFAANPLNRVLVYLMKCIPITRGSSRQDVARVLAKVAWLLDNGETALVFPEGGRSRSGRVDVAAATYGAGRIVNALGGCRVLCVYLRGERQESWSGLPARGERFRVLLDELVPEVRHKGLRGSVDVTRQILERLAALETRYFDDRK